MGSVYSRHLLYYADCFPVGKILIVLVMSGLEMISRPYFYWSDTSQMNCNDAFAIIPVNPKAEDIVFFAAQLKIGRIKLTMGRIKVRMGRISQRLGRIN